MVSKSREVPAIVLQDQPLIYLAAIPGKWLFEHTTPVWRIKDPLKGFQRMVKEARARQIAATVLEQKRTFPNSIILATDASKFAGSANQLVLPDKTKFLVVDGQHRLYAQKFSQFEATYACVLHMARTEIEMARLFLEINDNQKRVPSSLRWDLVRLVKPEGQEAKQKTVDLVYDLSTDKDGPLFQRIDLTGEQPEIKLKQGSLAPEIESLIQRTKKFEGDYEDFLTLLTNFFVVLQGLDPDGWRSSQSVFYKARVIRALLRLLTDFILEHKSVPKLTIKVLDEYLRKVKVESLTKEELQSKQGAAGVQQIHNELRGQVGLA